VNVNDVSIIERLREAARQHGEVADLLMCLACSFPFLGEGDDSFKSSPDDHHHLEIAVMTAAFVEHDQQVKDGSHSFDQA